MFFEKLLQYMKPKNARADIPVAVTGDATPAYSDKLTIEAVQVVVDASKHVPPQADVHVRMLFDETGGMVACHVEHVCSKSPLGVSGTSTLVDGRRSPAPSALTTTSNYVPVSDLKLTAASRIRSPQSAAVPKLSMADLRVYKVLGSGAQGMVSLVKYTPNGYLYALKAMKKSAHMGESLAFVFQEQAILKSLAGSPWFLQLRGSFEDSEYFYLLTDAYPKGDLKARLEERGKLTASEARHFAAQLVLGLEELQKRRIIHRDIKPANILITSDNNLIYSDFGLARSYDLPEEKQPWKLRQSWVLSKVAELVAGDAGDITIRACGTASHMAPEVLNQTPYLYAADVYSVGVVLYQMLCGRLPFGIDLCRDPAEVYQRIMTHDLEVDGDVDISAHHLLHLMLRKDPSHRATIERIKAHPWFASIDWKALSMRKRQKLLEPDGLKPDEHADEIPVGTEYPAGEAPHWWYEWFSPTVPSKANQSTRSLRKRRAAWEKAEKMPTPHTHDVPAALSAMFVTPAIPSMPAQMQETSQMFLSPLPRSCAPSPTLCASTTTASTAVDRPLEADEKDKVPSKFSFLLSSSPKPKTQCPTSRSPIPSLFRKAPAVLSGVRRNFRGVKTVQRRADRHVDLLD